MIFSARVPEGLGFPIRVGSILSRSPIFIRIVRCVAGPVFVYEPRCAHGEYPHTIDGVFWVDFVEVTGGFDSVEVTSSTSLRLLLGGRLRFADLLS